MDIKNLELALELFKILIARSVMSQYGYSELCYPGYVITAFYKSGNIAFQVQKATGPVTREIYFPTTSETVKLIGELAI